MTVSGVFYALIYAVVRGLTDIFPVNQVVFFRATLGALFMLPWVFSVGLTGLQTKRMPLYVWRMIWSFFGAVTWMYGIAYMPLADASALMFTMPLFTVMFAALWLAEKPSRHRWSATVAGFVGALIIIRPGLIELSLPAIATLVAAASFSVALIATKSLTRTENPNVMVFYLYGLMIVPSLVCALWDWRSPVAGDIPLLVALGLCTVGAQQCQTRAFGVAPASLVVIVNYLQLPMIAVLGYVIFGQSTDIWTWTGAAVICGSTYYVSYRESRAARLAREAACKKS
jgi:drug/metabolite transporter (DMT)-like permease